MSLPPLLVPGQKCQKNFDCKTCPGTSNGGRPRGVALDRAPCRLAGADVTSLPFEGLRYVGRLGMFRSGAVAETPSLSSKLGIAKK